VGSAGHRSCGDADTTILTFDGSRVRARDRHVEWAPIWPKEPNLGSGESDAIATLVHKAMVV